MLYTTGPFNHFSHMSTEQIAIDTVQELVEDALGDDACAHADADDLFHPQAVRFFADEPDCDFCGFSVSPVFEVNLITDETDDDHKHRLERHGNVLLYTVYHASTSNGVYNAYGQAIVCELGSDAEAVFSMQAAAAVALEAAGPLRSAMDAIRQAGLQLSPAVQETLVKQLFGS